MRLPCLLLIGSISAAAPAIGAAAEKRGGEPAAGIYHPDPAHLWNRLNEALFVRTGPDGRAYGHDRIEPLLWNWSKHLLEPRSRDRALAVLEEFIRERGERGADPLKRAILQRDLWLVFNWLEGDHRGFADPPLTTEAANASRERLRAPLATVIGRLALSGKQVNELPDNYSSAIASGKFLKQFDPRRPDKPYLPSDLFTTDGPWVCIGRPDGPVAPEHLREDGGNRFTNSAFLVFLRLPAGRAAARDYLQKLRSFNEPVLLSSPSGNANRAAVSVPNPNLPQLPPGAELALVRRAMLISSPRAVVASPLTESVQLRIHLERTYFREIRLSRSLLFAGQAGGLRSVGTAERDLKTGFNSHPWDPFEAAISDPQEFVRNRQPTVLTICAACHNRPGVHSFLSYFNFRFANPASGPHRRPAMLSEMSLNDALATAVRWKQSRSNWQALRALFESGAESRRGTSR